MESIKFTTTTEPNLAQIHELLSMDSQHLHIHMVDFPYRLTSTWQDQGCEFGLWEKGAQLLAWAVFQPPWWNLDFAIHPSQRGSSLPKEIFTWGVEQIMAYANRTGEEFYGSIEFFADEPYAHRTVAYLQELGFVKFDWSTVRFEIDLQQDLPQPKLPDGFSIRPLDGSAEVEDYVRLHRAAFGSDKMTVPWRKRTRLHPAYRPDIDLVVVNSENIPVGFCVCWMWQQVGQIEPLGVHPDYQGMGLGRALELSALQVLRNQGALVLYVDHVSLNEKAITLSLETGFKQSNNALRYYIDTSLHK